MGERSSPSHRPPSAASVYCCCCSCWGGLELRGCANKGHGRPIVAFAPTPSISTATSMQGHMQLLQPQQPHVRATSNAPARAAPALLRRRWCCGAARRAHAGLAAAAAAQPQQAPLAARIPSLVRRCGAEVRACVYVRACLHRRERAQVQACLRAC